ncbi:unnamed protein product, partial [Amoebophrya sp. A120]
QLTETACQAVEHQNAGGSSSSRQINLHASSTNIPISATGESGGTTAQHSDNEKSTCSETDGGGAGATS